MAHKHFAHPKDGRKLRVGACRKDKHDPSHTHYEAARWEPDELPPFVDLRAHLTPVEDQGEIGSCTANALAGALEYLEKRRTGREVNVSRLFIYWNERDVEGAADEDHGAALADGIKVLKGDGACSEDTWPYDKDLVFEKPADESYEEASNFTIDEAHRVKIELHDMRHCLAEGYPFVFGLELTKRFQDEGAHGSITVPDGEDDLEGGHAMLAVGYSDKEQCFLVRNSWGDDWGDGGYCYIPYEYMTNPDWCHDAWTIRKAHELDFTEGVHGTEDDRFLTDDNEEHTVDVDEETTSDEDETPSTGDEQTDERPDEDKSVEELEAEIAKLDEEIAELDKELEGSDDEEQS